MISTGLYRTTQPYPFAPESFPVNCLVYIGENESGMFVVIPYRNDNNRWMWQEPTTPLTDEVWASTLKRLPTEGFYNLPETIEFPKGGKWIANAIVQLGYNLQGGAILFVGEHRLAAPENALFFSSQGHPISDELLLRLRWAPVLPVRGGGEQKQLH
jgi:hypothetical protein